MPNQDDRRVSCLFTVSICRLDHAVLARGPFWFLGRLFIRVDLIIPVLNVRPSVCAYVRTYVCAYFCPYTKVSSILIWRVGRGR